MTDIETDAAVDSTIDTVPARLEHARNHLVATERALAARVPGPAELIWRELCQVGRTELARCDEIVPGQGPVGERMWRRCRSTRGQG